MPANLAFVAALGVEEFEDGVALEIAKGRDLAVMNAADTDYSADPNLAGAYTLLTPSYAP